MKRRACGPSTGASGRESQPSGFATGVLTGWNALAALARNVVYPCRKACWIFGNAIRGRGANRFGRSNGAGAASGWGNAGRLTCAAVMAVRPSSCGWNANAVGAARGPMPSPWATCWAASGRVRRVPRPPGRIYTPGYRRQHCCAAQRISACRGPSPDNRSRLDLSHGVQQAVRR